MKRIQQFTLSIFILSLFSAQEIKAQWGYTIGQREIPRVVVHKEASMIKVYPGHPRLFFRDTDLPALRERIKGDFKDEWLAMINDLESRALKQPAKTYAEGKFLKGWDTGRNMAFAAVVTREEKYIQWARQWMEALVAAGPIGNDDNYRGRLQSLAVAYDWLHEWLSEAEKQKVRDAIVAHIDRNWHFAEKPDFVGGHSRWGNFALMAGLLSVVTDLPELREKLLLVREHWLKGFHPLQGWIAEDGGYHMGWAYSGAYLTGSNHSVWSSATNESVYYPWLAKLPTFWIYGRQGDGLYPNTGDAYTVKNDLNVHRDLLMIAAGVLKDPYAAWTIRKSGNTFSEILYGDKNVKPLAPGNSAAPLPLSKNFGNAGVVIARDTWDEKATHFQFRSVPFYSANHHHRDENSFTIHYKGALAIDAGLYDEGGPNGGYGKSHWRNYFTRTVAHNAIVVFDPEQKMLVYNSPASNDGGQTYRTEPKRFEDILPGGHAHLDGIIQYAETKDYTYAVGDATKAYDPERVRLAQREVVYLRSPKAAHPIIVVFDRVESVKPGLQKKFLLHTVNQPVIKGNLSVTENKGGRLSCLTLLPEKATLELVGGPGKEFWVDGRNYPIDSEAWVRDGIEPGAWRLEVGPKKQQTMDYFLHVLFVDEAGAAPVDPRSVKLVKNSKSAGVVVDGWNITFPLAAGGKATLEPSK